MTTPHDRLDDAIDLVAARMTAVEADAALAGRIVSSLSERSVWLPRVWISRVAMGALAAAAVIVVLRPFYRSAGEGPAKAGHYSVGVGVGVGVGAGVGVGPDAGVSAGAGPAKAGHYTVDEGADPAEVAHQGATMVDNPDHEFSLAAIDAPDALSLTALTPTELALEPALAPASLMIADLPLSDFSPR